MLLEWDDRGGYCAKAYKKLSKSYPKFKKSYEGVRKLIIQQLDPASGTSPLDKRLHRVTDAEDFTLWKVPVYVDGLRPSQAPRFWFGQDKAAGSLVPLVLAMHKDNYDNNELDRQARSLMEDHLRTETD